jgi:hypothetical protein
MTVRVLDRPAAPRVPSCWDRGLNSLEPVTDDRLPEPVQLYALVTIALVLHEPDPEEGNCDCCGAAWPCEPVALAWRLREGF